jgi:predicted ATP-grasp superfamily ATP-dependent carboligase
MLGRTERGATVVLTDGDQRSTLAASRSLVRAGHTVHVVAPRAYSLAGVSRGVREHVMAVDAFADPDAFGGSVAALATGLGAQVLIPMTDASTTAILGHGEQLPRECRVPFPSLEAFLRASDKAAILPMAQAAGFAVPVSTVLRSREEATRVRLDGLAPGVLKPHRSVVEAGRALRRLAVVPYATIEEALALLGGLPDNAFPVVVQQRVNGPGVGYFALRWGGVVRASFAHRRLREVPPSGGVSVYREAIALPAALADAGNRLLTALDWEGVAMVECKHDPVTGRYHVIEINPRFWGSLQLAIDAGVDFPALLVACVQGQTPAPVPRYRVGLRCRWGWGDVDYLYLRAKLRSPQESALGAFCRALGEVISWSPGRDRGEILRWRDPRPFAVETLRRLHILR